MTDLVLKPRTTYTDDSPAVNTITESLTSNVVPENKLRKIQREVLNDMANTLRMTYGPKGSNSWIITGSDKASISSTFTKDGRSVLKKIIYIDPIAMALEDQIEEIALHTDSTVGDGTTSATLLSDAVFTQFVLRQSELKSSPQEIIDKFKGIVDQIKTDIETKSKTFDLDKVKDICITSTNNNVDLTEKIYSIYEKFGLEVYIDVLPSNDSFDKIKSLDGMTIDTGYDDPAYINTSEGSCTIHDAHVYYFYDPIDTPEMIQFLNEIVINNIITPVNAGEAPIPTVIMTPKITSDASPLLRELVAFLHQFDTNPEQKPPILIVSGTGYHAEKTDDIALLCGCKTIRKYIDPKIQEADIEKGLAPTLETICDFYGKCEAVTSDIGGTKFVNPQDMHERDSEGNIVYDENGEMKKSSTYESLHNFLASELQNATDNNEDSNTIGKLRRRLRSLEASMVELYIGGIAMADREATLASAIDAVKNCRSAAAYGYGRGANFEGFSSAVKVLENIITNNGDADTKVIAEMIVTAYKDIVKDLYVPLYGEEKTNAIISNCLSNDDIIYDIHTDSYDSRVITSIRADIEILDAVSKIVTLLMTTNQALIQHPSLNKY